MAGHLSSRLVGSVAVTRVGARARVATAVRRTRAGTAATTLASAALLGLLALVALLLAGLLLALSALAAVSVACADLGDAVVTGLAALVLRGQGDLDVGSVNRGQRGHALGVAGQLKHELAIVVDLDASGAVNLRPLQGQATAVALRDASANDTLAVDASRAAVRGLGLAAALGDRGHGHANTLLADVLDGDLREVTGDLHDGIVVLGAASASRARLRRAGARRAAGRRAGRGRAAGRRGARARRGGRVGALAATAATRVTADALGRAMLLVVV